ncbi:brain protein I3-like [Choloepus didactylus]|uniref:brain protein I3-like n=1 Tax=Choloepus didactylus TaxID=27675 RepID=UPI00189D10B9|nr:brain protein I3-like [Choloepus didactylus]
MDHKPLQHERRPPTTHLQGNGPAALTPPGPFLLQPTSSHGYPTTTPGSPCPQYPVNSMVVREGCPVCRFGVLEGFFTFLGIFLATILFPFGFIRCFALKRRCPNCGANFALREQYAELSYIQLSFLM